MRRAGLCLGILLSLALPVLSGQSPDPARPLSGNAVVVDGIAARIEDDIITESEVRELSGFQELVEGHAAPRKKALDELIDQWIIRTEANTALFPRPSEAEVDRELERLQQQFASPEAFRARLRELGLEEAAVRRLLRQQLFLTRFLDYRFRSTEAVDRKQIEDYYHQELAPQLAARGQPLPPLEDVENQIREVLTQRAISDHATRWLDDSKSRLKIDIKPGGSGG
jgi:parvulin-like peptidyl-prolyl isomerase